MQFVGMVVIKNIAFYPIIIATDIQADKENPIYPLNKQFVHPQKFKTHRREGGNVMTHLNCFGPEKCGREVLLVNCIRHCIHINSRNNLCMYATDWNVKERVVQEVGGDGNQLE